MRDKVPLVRIGALSLIQWAETLPAGEECSTLRTTAWKRALAVDPAAQAEIERIADLRLRDFCWAWTAHLLEGEAAQASIDRITDPDVRSQLRRYRTWKEDESSDDPFGGYGGPPLPWDE